MSEDSAEALLVQAEALLEAVQDVIDGKPVSDFMESFPLIARLRDRLAFTPSPQRVLGIDYGAPEGDFTGVSVHWKGVVGHGSSRNADRAVAYACEDLFKQLAARKP